MRNVLWNGRGGRSGSEAREALIQENLIVRIGSHIFERFGTVLKIIVC